MEDSKNNNKLGFLNLIWLTWRIGYRKLIFWGWLLGVIFIYISDHYLWLLGIPMNNITPAEKISLIVYFSTLAAVVWYTKETFDLKELSSKALVQGEIIRKKQIRSDLRLETIPNSYRQYGELVVGRVILKNFGRFPAIDVEADTDALEIGDETRTDFLSCPLNWTHSQIYHQNNNYHPLRNIYPGQSVHLDIFNYELNSRTLRLAVIVCRDIDNYSKLEIGENKLRIKLYQDSGQVVLLKLKIVWDGENIPTITEDS
jgi:hypothetical protein